MLLRSQRQSHFLALLFITSSVAIIQRTIINDFSDYPSGAQQCLYDASDNSGCDGDTVPEMNECLCGNGGDFVTNSAKCVADNDSGDMESTYSAMNLHCSDSDTPLSVSRQEWMAGEASVTISTSSTKTASETSTNKAASTISTIVTASTGQTIAATTTGAPSSTYTPDLQSNSELSTGAKVGIIVGSAAAGLALLAAALLFLCRHRRLRNHTYKEVHHTGAPLSSNTIGEGGTVLGLTGSEATNPIGTSTASSDLRNPRKSWQSAADGRQIPWSPGAFEAVKLHLGSGNLHKQPPDVFEMSTDSERPVSIAPPIAPVEMPAISVTSPTVSPSSRYSETNWTSQNKEPNRYQPYRSSR